MYRFPCDSLFPVFSRWCLAPCKKTIYLPFKSRVSAPGLQLGSPRKSPSLLFFSIRMLEREASQRCFVPTFTGLWTYWSGLAGCKLQPSAPLNLDWELVNQDWRHSYLFLPPIKSVSCTANFNFLLNVFCLLRWFYLLSHCPFVWILTSMCLVCLFK